MVIYSLFFIQGIITTAAIKYISTTSKYDAEGSRIRSQSILYSNDDSEIDTDEIDHLDSTNKLKNENTKADNKSNKLQPNTNVYKFTDFLVDVIDILNHFNDEELEQFFFIFSDEIKKYYYRGCKFYELMTDYEFRKYLAINLDVIKKSKAYTIKKEMKILSNKIDHEKFSKEEKSLVEGINELYKPDSSYKFQIFLISIDGYRLKTRKNLILSKIIQDGVRSIIFDYYTQLNDTTRQSFQRKIKKYWAYLKKSNTINIYNKEVTQTVLTSKIVSKETADTVKQELVKAKTDKQKKRFSIEEKTTKEKVSESVVSMPFTPKTTRSIKLKKYANTLDDIQTVWYKDVEMVETYDPVLIGEATRRMKAFEDKEPSTSKTFDYETERPEMNPYEPKLYLKKPEFHIVMPPPIYGMAYVKTSPTYPTKNNGRNKHKHQKPQKEATRFEYQKRSNNNNTSTETKPILDRNLLERIKKLETELTIVKTQIKNATSVARESDGEKQKKKSKLKELQPSKNVFSNEIKHGKQTRGNKVLNDMDIYNESLKDEKTAYSKNLVFKLKSTRKSYTSEKETNRKQALREVDDEVKPDFILQRKYDLNKKTLLHKVVSNSDKSLLYRSSNKIKNNGSVGEKTNELSKQNMYNNKNRNSLMQSNKDMFNEIDDITTRTNLKSARPSNYVKRSELKIKEATTHIPRSTTTLTSKNTTSDLTPEELNYRIDSYYVKDLTSTLHPIIETVTSKNIQESSTATEDIKMVLRKMLVFHAERKEADKNSELRETVNKVNPANGVRKYFDNMFFQRSRRPF